MATTVKSNSLSEYELARLERIKENQQMLEELFPEGTSVVKSYPGRRRKRSDDDNSRCSGDGTPEQFDSPQKKHRYSVRLVVHVRHCPLAKCVCFHHYHIDGIIGDCVILHMLSIQTVLSECFVYSILYWYQ